MLKHLMFNKRFYIPLIVVFIIAIAIFRHLNPNVGFTYLEPSYLPPGKSIKAKRIDEFRGKVDGIEQNFRTQDWVYAIRESKAGGFNTVGSALQNYNPSSLKPSCDIRTSPAYIRYRICHWIDYGFIDVHEVEFVQDGTYVYSQIPGSTKDQISMQELDKYVDSFRPHSTLGMPVLDNYGG